jgi:hypothetical protein
MGCRLVIGFIEHLQIVTTSNYSAIINSHTLHFTTQEDGSVVYNCCWVSPVQSFSGPSPAGLVTIFYCLRFETLPTWKARSPYLYPPGTRWPSYTPRHWVRSSHRQRYITTDSESASPSWCQAAICDPRPIFPILSLIIFLYIFGFVDVVRPL